jgi:hypothetical protein
MSDALAAWPGSIVSAWELVGREIESGQRNGLKFDENIGSLKRFCVRLLSLSLSLS